MKKNQYKDAKVLITGGLGFIGSNLAFRLLELGANVTLIDGLLDSYGGNIYNIHEIRDRVRLNISDIRDNCSLRHFLIDKDYLFNLAAQIGHVRSIEDPITDFDINCRAQIGILETCRSKNKNIKIVYTSTRQVYGKIKNLPVNENHQIQPRDANGISKYAAEQYHLLYNRIYGTKTTVLRLTNTYGPRMRIKDGQQTFIGFWIRKLIEGKPFEVWGGEQQRDLINVEDVVNAILCAANNECAYGEVFNIGTGEPKTIQELAEMLVEINGNGKYIIKDYPEKRKKIEIGNYYTDWNKAKELLGWKPKISIQEGLRKTLTYYRENLGLYI